MRFHIIKKFQQKQILTVLKYENFQDLTLIRADIQILATCKQNWMSFYIILKYITYQSNYYLYNLPAMHHQQHFQDHQQDILYALRLSLAPKSNDQIREATQMLEVLSQMKGYVPDILKILNDDTSKEQIICAALAQLKNFLRLRAYFTRANYRQKKVLDQQDHHYLIHHIFQTTIKLSSHYKFTKLLKDIIVIIGKDCEEIVPIICNCLQGGEQIKCCLNFLLGLSDSYKANCEMQKIAIFMQILKKIIPLLTNFIKNGQNYLTQLYDLVSENPTQELVNQYRERKDYFEEILYMSIKFMSKAIIRDFTEDLKLYACTWAEICINRLNQNIDHYHEATNLQNQCGNRGTTIFYYFHGKKWAAKYLRNFTQKLLLTKKSKKQGYNDFFQKNSQALISCISRLFLHKQPKKVRYNELRFLNALARFKFELLANILVELQLQILPNLMLMEQDDIQLAIQNPSQFYFKENDDNNQYENIRIQAFDIWIALVMKDADANVKKIQPNQSIQHLIKVIQVLRSWIKQQSIKKLSVALYILIKFSKHIHPYAKLHGIFKEIMLECFPALLNVDLYILKLLSLDMIISYGKYLHESRVAQIKNYILDLICNNKYTNIQGIETLQIKSILALKKVSYHQSLPQFRNIEDWQLKKILDKMIEFVRLYEVQEIMTELSLFVDAYSPNLMSYTEQVARSMMNIVLNCIQKSTEQGNQHQNHQHHDYHMICSQATEVIRSIIPIACSSNNHHLIGLFQQIIVTMTFQVLIKDEGEQLQFFQNVSLVICSFLNSMHRNGKKISSNLLFFYHYFICKISTLSQQNIDKIEVLFLKNQEKQLLRTCNRSYAINYQINFMLLRHFIRFIDAINVPVRKIAQINSNIFEANQLEQLFSFIAQFYNKSKRQRQTIDIIKEKLLACHLLMALYENYSGNLDISCQNNVFVIIKSNAQSKYAIRYFQKINLQLFCLWLWSNKMRAIQFIHKHPQFIQRIFDFEHERNIKRPKNYEQLRRLILGLTTLIKLSFCSPIVATHIENYLYLSIKCSKQIVSFQHVDPDHSSQTQYFSDNQQTEWQNTNQTGTNRVTLQEANFVIEIPAFRNHQYHDLYRNGEKGELTEFYIDEYCEEQYVSALDAEDELAYFLNTMVEFRTASPQYYDALVLSRYNKQIIQIIDGGDFLKTNLYHCLFKVEEMQIAEIFNARYHPTEDRSLNQKQQ